MSKRINGKNPIILVENISNFLKQNLILEYSSLEFQDQVIFFFIENNFFTVH